MSVSLPAPFSTYGDPEGAVDPQTARYPMIDEELGMEEGEAFFAPVPSYLRRGGSVEQRMLTRISQASSSGPRVLRSGTRTLRSGARTLRGLELAGIEFGAMPDPSMMISGLSYKVGEFAEQQSSLALGLGLVGGFALSARKQSCTATKLVGLGIGLVSTYYLGQRLLGGEDEGMGRPIIPVIYRRSIASINRQIVQKRNALAKAKRPKRRMNLLADIRKLEARKAEILSRVKGRAMKRAAEGKVLRARQMRLVGNQVPVVTMKNRSLPTATDEGFEDSGGETDTFQASTVDQQAQAVEGEIVTADGPNYMLWGAGAVVLLGGAYLVSKSKKGKGSTRVVMAGARAA
jgi:hypothetical protein